MHGGLARAGVRTRVWDAPCKKSLFHSLSLFLSIVRPSGATRIADQREQMDHDGCQPFSAGRDLFRLGRNGDARSRVLAEGDTAGVLGKLFSIKMLRVEIQRHARQSVSGIRCG